MKSLGVIALAVGLLLGLGDPAMAQKGKVVYIGSGGSKLNTTLIKAFNKKYPDITVEAIVASGGGLLARLKAEAGSPTADVIYTNFDTYQNAPELFLSYKTKDHDRFPKFAIGKDNLYYGYTMTAQLFIVNTKLMPLADAPKSWKDLANPKYKGKILWANPSLSGGAYGSLAQMIQLYGWDFVEKVIENAILVPNSRLTFTNVAKGEYEIGLTEETKAFGQKEKGYPVEVVYPEEGLVWRGAAVGLIKGAANLENAKIFADWHNSAEGQAINVNLRNRRVYHRDAPPVKGIPDLETIKLCDCYDYGWAAREKLNNLKKFDALLAKRGKKG